MAKENKLLYGPLVEGSQEIYSDLINVDFVKPPYSKLKDTNRVFVRRRRGYQRISLTFNIDGNQFSGDATFNNGTITDIKFIDGSWYYLWISDDSKRVRVYRRTEGSCSIDLLKDDCACKGMSDKLIQTDYVKGTPRLTVVAKELGVWVTDDSRYCTGYQRNETITTGVIEGRLGNSFFSAGNFADFNVNNRAANSIENGDYVVIYQVSSTGTCGQINRVIGYDSAKKELRLENPRVGITGTTGTVCYAIYPEYGETVIYPTCSGAKTITGNAIIDNIDPDTGITSLPFDGVGDALPFCGVDECQGEIIEYQGQNGNTHLAFYDPDSSLLQYTLPNLQKGYITSYAILKSGIKGMTSFQNYGVYFGERFVGAYYLTEVNGEYVLNGGISRDNLGAWVNSNGKADGYTQFQNSLYMVGSNRHIYAFSVVPTQFGTLSFKLDDLTDDAFCKYIIGDLEAVKKGDDIRIQATDDIFRVFINHKNGNGPLTKILTFDKRYKMRTKHYLCCGEIRGEVDGQYYGDDLYIRCGNTDCDGNIKPDVGTKIEGLVRWYLGDDVSGGNQKTNSFSNKELDWIKTQIGRNTDGIENTTLLIYSQRNLYKPKFQLHNFESNPYIRVLHDIMSGELNILVPECNIKQLKPCEGFNDPCEGSKLPYVERKDCECPEMDFVGEHCICIEDKKHFMADFVNLHTKLNGMAGKMFIFELRFTDDLEFGGFMLQYKEGDYEDHIDCEKRECKDCAEFKECCKGKRERACG